MIAAIFIIGAEINAAILKYRVKRMVRRSFQFRNGSEAVRDEQDLDD
jgi:membrane protein